MQKTMTTSASARANKRKSPDEVVNDITHISLSIKSMDGRQLYFRVNQDTQLLKVFKEYCERKELEFDTMQFLYEGSHVRGRDTPKTLNMENGAEIYAARHQIGGGVAALNFQLG
ncbi:hypothetical protein VNO77_01226 [Canavalia gladiata]|uniref:Ubiquitin-like domain-containing protein n=1 Tax=Canavalia gladiata TaxID=3824 RepID=A0AAN9MXD1_CANGL